MLKGATACAKDAAAMLQNILQIYDADNLQEVHEIKNKGDVLRRNLASKLVKEFIAPLEWEDILALIDQTDDVTGMVDDIVLKYTCTT